LIYSTLSSRASFVPAPFIIIVSSLEIITYLQFPITFISAFSNVNPTSSLTTVPPV